jgi:hypothetical protein
MFDYIGVNIMATPSKIIDKKAESRQGMVLGIAFVLALISWVSFSNGNVGGGFFFAGSAILLGWIGLKIKTTYHKYVEGAKYR